ncbi:MAG: hypothetical protein AAFR00_00150 [Pseudomonadota bacterium]
MTEKPDLESILHSLVPSSEPLLWSGQSDRRLLIRRNWIGFGWLLVSLPVFFLIAGATFLAAIHVMSALPTNQLGLAIELAIVVVSFFALIAAVLWMFAHSMSRGFGDSLGAHEVITGITPQRIIVLNGPGTIHRRICLRGTFQDMSIRQFNDEIASFHLRSSAKQVADLRISYVKPAKKVAQLLQSQLDVDLNDTQNPIEGPTP